MRPHHLPPRLFRLLVTCAALLAAAPALAGDDPAPAGGAQAPPSAEGSVGVEEGSESLTSALQGKEGVRIQTMCTHCNSANIQVGGLAEDLVPIFRNGYPVLGGLATSFLLSVLPADTVAEAQVARGPGEVVVPAPGAGGTIRLTEATPLELPRFGALLQAGSFDHRAGSLRYADELTRWLSFSVIGGAAEADAADDDGNGWNDVPTVDRTYGEARMVLAPNRDHSIDLAASWIDEENLEGRGAYDVLRALQEPGDAPYWTREDALFERREYRAGWEWRQQDGRKLEVRALTAERDQTVRSQLTAIPDFFGGELDSSALFDRFNIEEDNAWGRVSYTLPAGYRWRFRGAVDVRQDEVGAESVEIFDLIGGEQPEPEEGREEVELLSAYVDARLAVNPQWDLQLGVRWDDARWEGLTDAVLGTLTYAREDSQVSPRLTVRWFPARGWSFKLIGGRTFRPPRPILSEVCCGQTYQINRFVAAETGTTVGLEGVYQPSPRLKASLYLARTDFDDHIVRMVGWSQFFIQTYANVNIPEAEADTAEVAVTWSLGQRWSFDASVGWLDFVNTGDTDVAARVTPPSFAEPQTVIIPIDQVPYRPERTASLNATVELPKGVSVTAGGAYTGPMLIQQFDQIGLLDELRETDPFWLVSASVQVPIHRHVDLVLGGDNLADEIQDDLGDPTTDYNWGPLTGRTWRAALRVHLDR
jgi:outer membrane receptor protein involved in Fe transport